MTRSLRPALLGLALAALSGCTVPYAVGTTARTTPTGAVEPHATFQYASHDRARDDDEDESPTFSLNNGARLGLDERSDAGFTIVGLNGAVVSYGRRLTGPAGTDEGVTAHVGLGVLGGLRHVHAEASLVASGAPFGQVAPYGGIRAQTVQPFADADAVAASAVGAFAGARLGWPDLAITPELGVFYSPGVTRFESDWVVAPSVTLRGDRLLRAIGL